MVHLHRSITVVAYRLYVNRKLLLPRAGRRRGRSKDDPPSYIVQRTQQSPGGIMKNKNGE